MTLQLFVQLHGGCGYSHDNRAERYPSLAAAAAEYDRRFRDSYYPCWGDAGYADLTNDGRVHAGMAWYVDPDDSRTVLDHDDSGCVWLDTTDMYPDRELTRGPRGGLRWERC